MTGNNHVNNGIRALCGVLMVSVTMVCAVSNNGWAMLAPAKVAASAEGAAYDKTADMKTVQTALESKIVRERLHSLGMSDKEVESRLSRLSEKQMHQLAKNISALKSGGGLIGLLELVVLVILIIILLRAV